MALSLIVWFAALKQGVLPREYFGDGNPVGRADAGLVIRRSSSPVSQKRVVGGVGGMIPYTGRRDKRLRISNRRFTFDVWVMSSLCVLKS